MMALRSLAFALSVLPAFVFSQEDSSSTDAALAAITDAPQAPVNCDDKCYVVVDIAQVVFGNTLITAFQTNVDVVQQSPNGTNVTTTTTIIDGRTQFSYDANGLIPPSTAGGASSQLNFEGGSLATFAGATLTSPTAYEVLTAYSIYNPTVVDGKCSLVPGTQSVLPTPVSKEIPQNAPADFLVDFQNEFIQNQPELDCQPLGANVNSVSQVQATLLTTSSTIVQPFRFTPQPISTIGAPTVAATTTLTATATNGSIIGIPTVIISPGKAATSSEISSLILVGTGLAGILITALAF